MDTTQFVLSHLPPRPARVLEVGCGQGELASALSRAGYDVTAVDPQAPAGAIFRPVTLEAFDEPGPFAAVVASRSLHHIHDLGGALDKIVRLLARDGVLVLEEFGWERMDRATAEWYYGQARALAAAGHGEHLPPSLDACWQDWVAKHEDLHGFAEMRAELERRFAERFFEWTPYLHRLLAGVATEALERGLIAAGAIRALGFRYVGLRRS